MGRRGYPAEFRQRVLDLSGLEGPVSVVRAFQRVPLEPRLERRPRPPHSRSSRGIRFGSRTRRPSLLTLIRALLLEDADDVPFGGQRELAPRSP
jgi:hypothetical protein